eukprot:scaffold21.g2163.t1
MAWHNATYSLTVLDAAQPAVELEAALKTASPQIVVVIGVADGSPAAAALPALLAAAPTVVVLDSGAALRAAATRLGGRVALAPKGPLERLLDLLPWSAARHDAQARRRRHACVRQGGGKGAHHRRLRAARRAHARMRCAPLAKPQVLASVEELFSRRNSEDLLFAMLVLVNEHVAEVCSYRCIASYESPPLAAFSLCILQKHNCLGLTASPPAVPDPAPADAHGGRPMTHELAEDLFVGWLEGAAAASQALSPDAQARTGPFSWRVFGGKNPAYDYFPCQFQLFYRGQAKNSMWYDPIFKVKTLDGREVWRQRHYRVRRGKVPGTFHLSVLDNGVTSLEFWRILDCHERLEWCVFYYTGAAAAAGASYAGAILGSPSGARPTGAADLGRIAAALERAGIKMWELSNVDNSNCVGAPLVPAAAFG